MPPFQLSVREIRDWDNRNIQNEEYFLSFILIIIDRNQNVMGINT
jgi:hypothetical protein